MSEPLDRIEHNEADGLTRTLGRRVMAADTATDVGTVKSVVFDQPPRSIVSMHVAGRKGGARVVDWADVTGFGPDAVMISSAAASHAVDDDRTDAVVRGRVDLLGARILDTDGFGHGTVVDAEIDTQDGRLLAVMSNERRWSVDEVRSLGSYALVVAGP